METFIKYNSYLSLDIVWKNLAYYSTQPQINKNYKFMIFGIWIRSQLQEEAEDCLTDQEN